jgi:hypothetical protein
VEMIILYAGIFQVPCYFHVFDLWWLFGCLCECAYIIHTYAYIWLYISPANIVIYVCVCIRVYTHTYSEALYYHDSMLVVQ